VTTPIVNEPVPKSREDEIYAPPNSGATRAAPSAERPRPRWLVVAEGAILGVAFWLLLFTLGVPWVFHAGAFDGLLPMAFVGTLIALTRGLAILRAAVIAQLLLLIFVAYTPVVVGPARSLIRNDPLPSHADAIVVLAAGTSDDALILPQAVDRLLKGLELLNRGVAPLLVLPTEAFNIGSRLVTSRDDQHRIVSLVPGAASKIVLSGLTYSTRDEAVQTEKLYRSRGWKRVVVVTSPLHTRRACGTFEKVGIIVSCAAADSREMAIYTMRKHEDRVRGFQGWLYETAGTIRYRQLGWL
jgi:uncharacterized SAM-binding protein YcdF (DUF218 family)